MRRHSSVQQRLTNAHFTLAAHEVTLTHIELLRHTNGIELRCEVISSGFLSKAEKQELKAQIEKSAGEKVEVIATFRYRL